MGAPKHKWSEEEEAALRCAVIKHGAGKWRTILKDPDFSDVLFLRSNVDLKDKWRNLNVMGPGSGSRSKSSVAVKRTHRSLPSDEEILDALPVSTRRMPNWLDSLITEAISTMKESGGSSKTAIANYIQERYQVPPNFKRMLSAKLKYFSAFGTGKLIKAKRKYRIPNSTALSSHKKRLLGTSSGKKSIPSLPSPETDRYETDSDEESVERKSEIDAELARKMIVNIHEAAEMAAQAVAEAEAAMAEADEAARQAEVAEAEAEAAQVFAEEVSKTLKGINNSDMTIPA